MDLTQSTEQRLQFDCTHCSKKFLSDSALYQHRYQYHIRGEYRCQEIDCQFVAQYRSELGKHRYHEHTKVEFCPFEGCDKKFRVKGQLTRHLKSEHQDIKAVPSSEPTQPQHGQRSTKMYRCKWDRCCYMSKQRGRVSHHILGHLTVTQHNSAPSTSTQQRSSGLVRTQTREDNEKKMLEYLEELTI